MEVAGAVARNQSHNLTQDGGVRYERQARFIVWATQLFDRARLQGVELESLTDFELAWIGRM